MARYSVPGRHFWKRLGLKALFWKFPDNTRTEKWFQEWIWKGKPHCPRYGVRESRHASCASHHAAPMQGKGMLQILLGEDRHRHGSFEYFLSRLGDCPLPVPHESQGHILHDLTQTTAWFLLRRLREADESDPILFSGVVEVDETFIGGKTGRMNAKQYASWFKKTDGGGGGATGKTPVACILEKGSGRIRMAVLRDTGRESVTGFVLEHTVEGTEVHTDEFKAYAGLDETGRKHETVNHKKGRYVRYEKTDRGCKVITTNGCGSVCGTLKASPVGVFHQISVKHLPLYLNELVGRRNSRELDTLDQSGALAFAMKGRRLRFKDLTARTPEQEEAYAARNCGKFGLRQACREAAGL